MALVKLLKGHHGRVQALEDDDCVESLRVGSETLTEEDIKDIRKYKKIWGVLMPIVAEIETEAGVVELTKEEWITRLKISYKKHLETMKDESICEHGSQ